MGTAGSTRPQDRETFADALLYATAAISYVSLAIFHKWLLDWIVGPAWCIAWVWGIPALWRVLHGRPVRPQRGPRPSEPDADPEVGDQ